MEPLKISSHPILLLDMFVNKLSDERLLESHTDFRKKQNKEVIGSFFPLVCVCGWVGNEAYKTMTFMLCV